jgi:hypothetical protein
MTVVFRFQTWDVSNDCYKLSRRLATREAIARIGGEPLGEGINIDASLLGTEIQGMTDRDFDPRPRSNAGMR